MILKLPFFVDARYNAEQDLQFDGDNVAALEETMRSLFMGGSHPTTRLALKDGRRYTLAGHVQDRIELARRAASPVE